LRKLIGLKNIPSVSTVGDWLRRMGNSEGLDLFKQVIDKEVIDFLMDKGTTFTIAVDKDAAVKEV